MEFQLSEEQESLQGFVCELLTQRADSAKVRATLASDEAYDRDLWRVLCEEIGAASLAIPEEWGGSGFTTRETHIVLEELGRALAPSPFLGSVGIASQAILAANHAATNERLLPGIASGESVAALAWATPTGKWNPAEAAVTATSGESVTLSGRAPLVISGSEADTFVVIARSPEGAALYAVTDASQMSREATPTLDQTLSLAACTFDGVAAERISAPGDDSVFDAVLAHVLTAVTATQIGTAARALDMTVEYSKQRSQFGRVIGSFQALKHRMADMHVQLETARTTSFAAAWATANGEPGALDLARIAKATCSEALSHIAGETIQLHGGIAITWEHDAHLIFKRAHATNQLFGTAREQRIRIAETLAL